MPNFFLILFSVLSFACARLKFSKMTVPDDGFSIEDSTFRSVDLPAPEAPVTNTSSPGSISKLTF